MEKEKKVPLVYSVRILLFSALIVNFLVPAGLSVGISLYGSNSWLPKDMVSIFSVIWGSFLIVGIFSKRVRQIFNPVCFTVITAISTMLLVVGEILWGGAFLFLIVLPLIKGQHLKTSIVWILLAEALSIFGSVHFLALGSDPGWTIACIIIGSLFIFFHPSFEEKKKEEETLKSI